MKYLTGFRDVISAEERSAEIAKSLGCGRNTNDVTRLWYRVIENENTGEAAIEVPEGDDKNLRGGEVSKLLTDAQIKSRGFIKDKKLSDLEDVPIIGGIPVATTGIGKVLYEMAIKPIMKAVGI